MVDEGTLEKFKLLLSSDEKFQLVKSLVQKNSKGKVWLMGGTVSRNLSNIIHGEDRFVECDFDFLVEGLVDDIALPDGWSVVFNSFRNPKFVGPNGLSVDVVPITNVLALKERGLDFSLENFLLSVPFTPQSLVYDLVEEKVVGDVGIRSIVNREFKVNDLERAEYLASLKGVSLGELIKRKADSMGFSF